MEDNREIIQKGETLHRWNAGWHVAGGGVQVSVWRVASTRPDPDYKIRIERLGDLETDEPNHDIDAESLATLLEYVAKANRWIEADKHRGYERSAFQR